ncbi:hypothetical protein [Pseudomonas phage vB_PaeM_RP7]|nr:MAG: hypothetical protein [Pseudomonas phage RP4]WAB56783.1 hypothetical protein [Pseudomonas phage vB_PaeM_RP15]WAB56897.1 hypothetical protein [Pseudomonas phage vB_PaeM_RP6]WAB57194.1 hypothetical protein [Pseudomonas phage vB_PaeM_RP7]WAB57331.1 hypothetical protein [Pseudomonas phage vB_PaeM_RP8]WAB57408.1 hypothetical protein [Pseudomonas phage vB_PaeM_RP9]WAB57696.1 hypothetical protein [Pseudomonas phage vB_PaeM_RP10]WAB57812.1 hypothetical protein [Pseudomonas phage vB_PaeM_RP11]
MLIAAGRYIVQTSLRGMVVQVSDEIPKEEEEK